MEVPHADLTEVTGVVLVEIGTVVVLTTGHTTTTGVLAVLANTTFTGGDMTAAILKKEEEEEKKQMVSLRSYFQCFGRDSKSCLHKVKSFRVQHSQRPHKIGRYRLTVSLSACNG